MTRGSQSSECKFAYKAFIATLIIAAVGILTKSDLMGVAAIIGALNTIPIGYAGARSYMKSNQGEE